MPNTAWPEPDGAAARRLARALAAALGSAAVADRRGVLGEPLCLYRIPLHEGELRFDVRVSDTACVVEGKHPRRDVLPVTLAASFGEPRYANTERAADLSAALGVHVYLPPEPGWDDAARVLRDPPLDDIIRRIDWTRVRRMSLFTTCLEALLGVDDVDRCAAQVRLLRDLLSAASRLAPPR